MANTATLFVLALAGGFLFAYLCHYTSYLASRVEGQRLVFFTAGYAVGLLVWSRLTLIVPLLTFRDCWLAAISDVWKFAVGPVHHPALATFFGAFVWAPILAWGVNRIYPYDRASDRAIEKYGGDTEKLLSRYITNTELVSITLDNRKVYIGWPTYTPSLRRETEDFRLLPVLKRLPGRENPRTTLHDILRRHPRSGGRRRDTRHRHQRPRSGYTAGGNHLAGAVQPQHSAGCI